MGFRDIRDFEEYKDREEDESSSRSLDFAERKVFSFLASPRGAVSAYSFPSPEEQSGAGGGGAETTEGGSRRYVPPQNLDGRTLAGRQPGARTVFGSEAWTEVGDRKAQRFVSPSIASPCVSRRVRREVMFAKRFAGKGYRSRKRLTEYSNVEC